MFLYFFVWYIWWMCHWYRHWCNIDCVIGRCCYIEVTFDCWRMSFLCCLSDPDRHCLIRLNHISNGEMTFSRNHVYSFSWDFIFINLSWWLVKVGTYIRHWIKFLIRECVIRIHAWSHCISLVWQVSCWRQPALKNQRSSLGSWHFRSKMMHVAKCIISSGSSCRCFLFFISFSEFPLAFKCFSFLDTVSKAYHICENGPWM